MSTTVESVVYELIKEKGESTSDADFIAQVRVWVSDAWLKLSGEVRWPFLFSKKDLQLTATVKEYPLPEDISEIISVRLSGSEHKPLGYTTYELIQKAGLDPDEAGKPEWFYLTGYDVDDEVSLISFYKVPDSNYAADLVGVLRGLPLGEGELIPAPLDLIPLVKDYARFLMYVDADPAKANTFRQNYEFELKKTIERLFPEKVDIMHFREQDLFGERRIFGPRLPDNFPL